jgi:hypothetical protein
MNENIYTIKERLTAMLVLQEIKNYAKPEDQEAAITAVLGLAMDIHKNGIDRSFVNQLEYPDVEVQNL